MGEFPSGLDEVRTNPQSAHKIVSAPARESGEQRPARGARSRHPAGEPVPADRHGDPTLGGGAAGQFFGVLDASGELGGDRQTCGSQDLHHFRELPGAAPAAGGRMDDQQQRLGGEWAGRARIGRIGHGSSLPGFRIPAGSSRCLTARSTSTPSSPISAASQGA